MFKFYLYIYDVILFVSKILSVVEKVFKTDRLWEKNLNIPSAYEDLKNKIRNWTDTTYYIFKYINNLLNNHVH